MQGEKKIEIMLLVAILFVAIFFRFFQLKTIPPGLYPDEAMNGNNALEALRNVDISKFRVGFKVFYPENNGREGMFINIQALSIKLFGNEPWALRIVSAIFGILTVLGIYFLTKELFPDSRWVPLLAAFFLATSFWHINFSRIGFRAISAPFFLVWGMWGLLRGLRTGSITSLALGGLLFGGGFNTYISYRLFPLILIPPFFISLQEWRKRREEKNKPCIPCAIALFLFFAFLAALPLGYYYMTHPSDFLGRASDVSIFNTPSPIKTLLWNTIKTLGQFNVWGDCNWRHNLASYQTIFGAICAPQLWWPIGLLFVLGVAIAIRNIWKKVPQMGPLLAVVVWLAVALLPGVLSGEGIPHALRTILALPPAMILAALGLSSIIGRIRLWLETNISNPAYTNYAPQLLRIKRELKILLVLFLIAIPVFTFRHYFVLWTTNENTYAAFSTPFVSIGKYINEAPSKIAKYIIVNQPGVMVRGIPMPAQTTMFISDTFLPQDQTAKNVHYLLPEQISSLNPPPGNVIIPLHFTTDIAKTLREKFPQGKFAPGDGFWLMRL